jgi:two-component system chemotaxis response regulator CheB
MTAHDIVVIGASAGGVSAIIELARRLPRDLPASILLTVHMSPESNSNLPTILRRAGELEVVFPRFSEPLQHGYIYVAPPNLHMTLEDGSLRLGDGPRENGARPAVDPLFRSAAEVAGPRVIGVILSGALDDGTNGLAAIKRRGGIAIVQDPNEAEFDGMPRSAIENVQVDYVLSVAEIAPLLVNLVGQQADPPLTVPKLPAVPSGPKPGEAEKGWQLQFSCPDCGGVLLPVEGETLNFKCEVGHLYSPITLLSEQSSHIEDALWTAIRALAEKARLSRQLAESMRARGFTLSAERFENQAQITQQHEATLKNLASALTLSSRNGEN